MGNTVENLKDFTVHERSLPFKTDPEVFYLVSINWDNPESFE